MYKRHLEFVEEASKKFEENYKLQTYRNNDEDLIALRWGWGEDCIRVYELGDYIGAFDNWFKKPTTKQKLEDVCNTINELKYDLNKEEVIEIAKCLNTQEKKYEIVLIEKLKTR